MLHPTSSLIKMGDICGLHPICVLVYVFHSTSTSLCVPSTLINRVHVSPKGVIVCVEHPAITLIKSEDTCAVHLIRVPVLLSPVTL